MPTQDPFSCRRPMLLKTNSGDNCVPFRRLCANIDIIAHSYGDFLWINIHANIFIYGYVRCVPHSNYFQGNRNNECFTIDPCTRKVLL